MNRDDAAVPRAILRVLPQVAEAIEIVAQWLKRGGRLFCVGNGTSGRIGALDAAEIPPTSGIDSRVIQFVMAAGSTRWHKPRKPARIRLSWDGEICRAEGPAADLLGPDPNGAVLPDYVRDGDITPATRERSEPSCLRLSYRGSLTESARAASSQMTSRALAPQPRHQARPEQNQCRWFRCRRLIPEIIRGGDAIQGH
jgi:hypothetical protein